MDKLNYFNQYERSTRGVRMVSRAMGTGEIREDNTPILAHEGEKLLTKQEAKKEDTRKLVLEKLADTIVVKDDRDLDEVVYELLLRLRKAQENMP